MKHIMSILTTLIIGLFISGCSMKGTEYTPNFNSINILKDNNLKKVNVKRNNLATGNESISLGRGSNKMLSPYGGDFSKYLEISVEEELKQAFIYDKKSNIEIDSKLLTNKLDTGISIGTAHLSGRFIIRIDNKEVYNNIHEIHHEWKSSFAAATAIPITISNYPIAMQKLIDKFLFDKDVIELIKNNLNI